MNWLGFNFREYLRFAASGAVAIAAYLLLFEAARRVPGLPLWLASGGTYALATCLNYALNYHWSFASQETHGRAFLKYAVIALTSVSLNAVTVPFLVSRGLDPAPAGFAFAITWPVFSYLAQKHWAFRSRSA